MTTYELPPEPPIGESVRDAYGRTWKHIGVNNWTANPDSVLIADSRPWLTLLASSPLTLIEPDPWPTAPLIVATFLDKRCVFGLTDVGSYDSPTGGLEAWPEGATLATRTRDTLTNVVPVTVVPTAEWEALAVAIRDHGVVDCYAEVVALLEATDALGVDL